MAFIGLPTGEMGGAWGGGRGVAVRANGQPTGAWARTILETESAVVCTKTEWITKEPQQVTGAPEPFTVIGDPNGASPL